MLITVLTGQITVTDGADHGDWRWATVTGGPDHGGWRARPRWPRWPTVAGGPDHDKFPACQSSPPAGSLGRSRMERVADSEHAPGPKHAAR